MLIILLASSSDSPEEYDLSDPEAELDVGIKCSVSSTYFGDTDIESSDSDDAFNSESHGGRGGRGPVKNTTLEKRRTAQVDQLEDVVVHDLNDINNNTPSAHIFMPSRHVGPHLPSDLIDPSPAEIFKLSFDHESVGMICRASNEYAELNKDKSSTMYSYYNEMTPDDFYKLEGIFIHLGYRKIPSCRLM